MVFRKIEYFSKNSWDEEEDWDDEEEDWDDGEGWKPKIFYYASLFDFSREIEIKITAREFREIEHIHDFSTFAIKVDEFGVSIRYGTQRYMLRFEEQDEPRGSERFNFEINENVLSTAFEMMCVEVLNKENRKLNKTIKKQMIFDENFLQFIFKTEKYKYTLPLSIVLQECND